MKAKELRIGNFITYHPDAVDEGTELIPLQIISISSEYDNVKLDEPFDNVYGFDEILPIQLTEQWLKDFGFAISYDTGNNKIYGHKKELDYYSDYGTQYVIIETLEREKKVIKYFEFGYYEKQIDCEFVHQLQNLYFALTGEDLTLNPPSNDQNQKP